MKRFCIGLILLAVLLTGGWLIQRRMDAILRPIASALQAAAEAALRQDWATALPLYEQAHARWAKHHRFTAAFADHTPMDEVDGLFAELQVFAAQREMPHFAALCLHLQQLANAMAESHSLSWWNLL